MKLSITQRAVGMVETFTKRMQKLPSRDYDLTWTLLMQAKEDMDRVRKAPKMATKSTAPTQPNAAKPQQTINMLNLLMPDQFAAHCPDGVPQDVWEDAIEATAEDPNLGYSEVEAIARRSMTINE